LKPSKNGGITVHFHGYDAYRHDLLKKYRTDYHRMFQVAERIIAVSKDMKGKLEREVGFSEKIIHSSCGFNPSILKSSKTIVKQANTVTFVGRLTPKKDPVGLIRAFAQVVSKIPQAQLTLIGDGELRPDCENIIRELSLGPNVALLGWKSHDEVLDIVRKSTVFVMNSVTAENGDKEGTPVAVMEAMALKNIVIATQHGGIVDIIKNGKTGLLYPEFDYGLLSRNVIAALSGACQPGIPNNARQYAIDNLSASLKNRLLNEIVRESIQNRPTRVA
jgi:colanic acid/amylovoran biosynthesis glycosyltransferase